MLIALALSPAAMVPYGKVARGPSLVSILTCVISLQQVRFASKSNEQFNTPITHWFRPLEALNVNFVTEAVISRGSLENGGGVTMNGRCP